MDKKMKLKVAGVLLLALILLIGGIYVIALKNGQTPKTEKKESNKVEQTVDTTTGSDEDETEKKQNQTEDDVVDVEAKDNKEPSTTEEKTEDKTEDKTEQVSKEKSITVNYLPESVSSVIDVQKLQKDAAVWLSENGMEDVTSMSYTDEEDLDTAHNSKSVVLLADGTVRYVMCTYSINDGSYTFMEM